MTSKSPSPAITDVFELWTPEEAAGIVELADNPNFDWKTHSLPRRYSFQDVEITREINETIVDMAKLIFAAVCEECGILANPDVRRNFGPHLHWYAPGDFQAPIKASRVTLICHLKGSEGLKLNGERFLLRPGEAVILNKGQTWEIAPIKNEEGRLDMTCYG